MVSLTINGTAVQVAEGTTILDAARQLGIYIPTLCYFEDLNAVGACRVCCVEVEGSERLEAACNTPVREGMVVLTNSPKAQAARRTNAELIASTHTFDCVSCHRNGTCVLQKVLDYCGVDGAKVAFDALAPSPRRREWPAAAPIQRDAAKCVQCGRCVAACGKLQGIGVWRFRGTGAHSRIAVDQDKPMFAEGCIACGQCITHCPVGALSERDDLARMMEAIRNPEVTTVVQIAPATRTAWASVFGAETGQLSVERMAACLKQLGVDYVFDTSFSADLTIMEEGTELLNIVKTGETDKLPLFTSCCPGWVNHAVNLGPQVAGHLSTAKSPMQMFGSLVKTWWAQKMGLDPAHIFSVALMPCTAKKNECKVPGMQANEGIYDMDASLTTREFARMVKAAGLNPLALEDVPLDNPLGTATGAGVIFGITGGVMEAALRSAYYFMTGEKPDPDGFVFEPAGEGRPWTEATFDLAGTPVRCAVVHSLAKADQLIAAWQAGEVDYDFVEVMACPGGCAGGGGQPIDGSDRECAAERGAVLRTLDQTAYPLRFSHENPVIETVYAEFYGQPCSEVSERYLHVHERQQPFAPVS
ncbi:MAG: [FeFe] hydrogenase, group A [Coriobacteriia bacterium]|nr:[FeFe] hydrogenase, group A [Coriobacteriia bacterium]